MATPNHLRHSIVAVRFDTNERWSIVVETGVEIRSKLVFNSAAWERKERRKKTLPTTMLTKFTRILYSGRMIHVRLDVSVFGLFSNCKVLVSATVVLFVQFCYTVCLFFYRGGGDVIPAAFFFSGEKKKKKEQK